MAAITGNPTWREVAEIADIYRAWREDVKEEEEQQ